MIANIDTKEKALNQNRRKLDGLKEPPPSKMKKPRQGKGMNRYSRKNSNHQNAKRAPPPNNRPEKNNSDPTLTPANNNNNSVHVNPHFTSQNESPQVTALLPGLGSHLSSFNPYVHQPSLLYGQATYALCLQQPSLYGIMYTLSCVKPGLYDFVEKFGDNKPPLRQFKVLCTFKNFRNSAICS